MYSDSTGMVRDVSSGGNWNDSPSGGGIIERPVWNDNNAPPVISRPVWNGNTGKSLIGAGINRVPFLGGNKWNLKFPNAPRWVDRYAGMPEDLRSNRLWTGTIILLGSWR